MSYTVQPGDTFWSISQANNTTVAAIEDANPSVNPNEIQVGQVINLPGGAGAGLPSVPGVSNYSIQAGDTLWSIAQAHNTTVDAILAVNNPLNDADLQVGQIIAIPSS